MEDQEWCKSGVVSYVRGLRVGAEVPPDVAQQRVRQRHHALSEKHELRRLRQRSSMASPVRVGRTVMKCRSAPGTTACSLGWSEERKPHSLSSADTRALTFLRLLVRHPGGDLQLRHEAPADGADEDEVLLEDLGEKLVVLALAAGVAPRHAPAKTRTVSLIASRPVSVLAAVRLLS